MKKVQLGQSDLMVTPICLGTMTFGEQNNQEQAFQQLDAAYDLGLHFIDTAEMYPVMARETTYGDTERFIGNWFEKNPGKRDNIVLASKVAGPARGMNWIREGSYPNKATIEQACNDSLARLKTDHIDLYQIHWPSRNVPVFGALYYDPSKDRPTPGFDEVLEAMQNLVKAGKIRYVGVSNETPWGIMEYSKIAKQANLPMIASMQNAYNLLNRQIENGLDEVCLRENVGILAYSPLAFGRLTGKYDAGGYTKEGKPVGRLTHFPPTWSPRYVRPETLIATRRYGEVAKAFGLSLTQLSLAFCRHKSFITSTIIGCTTVEQLHECVEASEVKLSPEIMAAVDAVRWDIRDPAQ